MSIHDGLKRQQHLAEDVDLRIDKLPESSGPNARLTHSENRTVVEYSGTEQRAGDYALECEARGYLRRLLSECSREDIALGKPEPRGSEDGKRQSFR
jgi:hypothetical protein